MALDLVYPRPSVEGDALPLPSPLRPAFPARPQAMGPMNLTCMITACGVRPQRTSCVSGDSMRDAAFMMAMCWSSIGQKSPGTQHRDCQHR